MKKTVKYDNRFNLPLLGFTAKEIDLLMCICAELKDQGCNEIDILFQDIADYLYDGCIPMKRLTNSLEKMCLHLAASISRSELVYENGKRRIDIVSMFSKFSIDENTRMLTVALNPYFLDMFNNFTSKWTKFSLEEFIGLRLKYSKLLYRYLKEKRCLGGRYKVSLEELRTNLDIPAAYSAGQIEQKILKPALEELTGVFDRLRMERTYEITRQRGRPAVNGFIISFKPEKRMTKDDYIRDAIFRSGGTPTDRICPKCGKPLMRKLINGHPCYCHFDYITGQCDEIYHDLSLLKTTDIPLGIDPEVFCLCNFSFFSN